MKYLKLAGLLLLVSGTIPAYGRATYREIALSKAPLFVGKQDVIGRQGLYANFWVCADARESRVDLFCDDLGVHEQEGPKAELRITMRSPGTIHEYGLRHGISKVECQRMQRSINKLTEKSRHYCIRGNFVDLHESSGLEAYDWVFFEFKTERGTVCDFCD